MLEGIYQREVDPNITGEDETTLEVDLENQFAIEKSKVKEVEKKVILSEEAKRAEIPDKTIKSSIKGSFLLKNESVKVGPGEEVKLNFKGTYLNRLLEINDLIGVIISVHEKYVEVKLAYDQQIDSGSMYFRANDKTFKIKVK